MRVESLENRVHLTTTVTTVGTVITISNDNSSDAISIGKPAGSLIVRENGIQVFAGPLGATYTEFRVLGNGGNDTLSTFSWEYSIGVKFYGGDGADTVMGTGYADYVEGGNGNDLVTGNSGNDTIYGGADNDTLQGVSHNDAIYGGDGNDSVYGGDHNDTVYGENGNDTVIGGLNGDTVSGGSGDDRLSYAVTGTTWVNISLDGAANDQERANGYTVSEQVATDFEYVYGSTGQDTLEGTSSEFVVLYGSDGNDSIISWGDDAYGEKGNDTLSSAEDSAEGCFLNGGTGNDSLVGSEFSDDLHGGAGSDKIFGNGSDDWFYFEEDGVADTLNGGAGTDLYGSRDAALDLLVSVEGTWVV